MGFSPSARRFTGPYTICSLLDNYSGKLRYFAMSAERPNSLTESKFVRGALVFVGVMVAAGIAIGFVNESIALASPLG